MRGSCSIIWGSVLLGCSGYYYLRCLLSPFENLRKSFNFLLYRILLLFLLLLLLLVLQLLLALLQQQTVVQRQQQSGGHPRPF